MNSSRHLLDCALPAQGRVAFALARTSEMSVGNSWVSGGGKTIDGVDPGEGSA